MGRKASHTGGLRAEAIHALLANGPAIVDIAQQLEIPVKELRGILYEALMHIHGIKPLIDDTVLAEVKSPAEVISLISGGLNLFQHKGNDR